MIKYTIFITIFILVGGSVFLFFIYQKTINHKDAVVETSKIIVEDTLSKEDITEDTKSVIDKVSLLDKLHIREIKKPFGIFITPEASPIQLERFAGYHTGTDFEISDDEIDADVMVHALCDGSVISKGFVRGYGGVLIQNCIIDGEAVTVLYGHLNIDTIQIGVGEVLQASDDVGLLGDDNSKQTDFERKHLHIGVHRGKNKNVRGYVQKKENVNDWIDVCTVVDCVIEL